MEQQILRETIKADKNHFLHIQLPKDFSDEVEVLILPLKSKVKKPEIKMSATKGKWGKIMEQIEQNAMGEEAGKEFDKGREEFRATFSIGDA